MDKVKGLIYGFAIGDALGVPFEFKARDSFVAEGMTGYGTYNQPKGTWSDDTSLLLATCASLKESNKVNLLDLRRRFEQWLFKGEYTVDGHVFGVGIATSQALKTRKGQDDFYSNGNGSLMRILPLAFVACSESDIAAVSSITHGHSISIRACQTLIRIIRELLSGKELREVLLSIDVDEELSRLCELENLSRDDIKSTGYVVDTLEAALWCVLHTTNYKEAVLLAVNLGDDTDTVAAITGGLSGLIYGYDNIPTDWLESLRNKELIERCLFESKV